ncbi:hypothetical protein I8J29_18040 [Paenibacillus sp. MWE-103]|uniref:YfhD-like protein n=1 Tax=Paenibacillus artemisiicola TaxID=1172618 RepID=A0ABS3WCV9_9BACL|nr:hypothetical protein [Paenibacillus artemisiicola]MBO7746114.1 hypothetical protein [Paenibacillus artemisiicola]
MMETIYVAEKIRSFREADWDRRIRRGEFVAPDAADAAEPASGQTKKQPARAGKLLDSQRDE